jgi:hypothetical protein
LTAEERRTRQIGFRDWLLEAAALLRAVRAVRSQSAASPPSGWTEDVENLYEFGVLRRKGILEALGRCHGLRLTRLLRVGDAPLDRGPSRAI